MVKEPPITVVNKTPRTRTRKRTASSSAPAEMTRWKKISCYTKEIV